MPCPAASATSPVVCSAAPPNPPAQRPLGYHDERNDSTPQQPRLLGRGQERGSVTFRFTRTETGPPPTVNFTLGGTASAGQPPGGDYYHNGTSVTFPGGSTTVDKTMTVFNDTAMEPNQSIILTISAWGGSGPQYTVGTPNSATAMIIDNDTPAITVASLGDVNESCGSVTFRFTRTETGPPPTVNFTLGGTTSTRQPPGGDYYHNGTSVTFQSGSTTVDKTMTVFNESTMEPDESIVLTISASGRSGPQYTVGTPSSATAMIIDIVKW